MAGLVPAIHVFFFGSRKDVDARHRAGHDGEYAQLRRIYRLSARCTASMIRSCVGSSR